MRRMTKFMTRADAGGMNGDIGQKDRPQTAPISLPIRMPSSGAAARMGTGWNGVQARDMQLSDRELIERTKVMLRSNPLASPASAAHTPSTPGAAISLRRKPSRPDRHDTHRLPRRRYA